MLRAAPTAASIGYKQGGTPAQTAFEDPTAIAIIPWRQGASLYGHIMLAFVFAIAVAIEEVQVESHV